MKPRLYRHSRAGVRVEDKGGFNRTSNLQKTRRLKPRLYRHSRAGVRVEESAVETVRLIFSRRPADIVCVDAVETVRPIFVCVDAVSTVRPIFVRIDGVSTTICICD